MSRATGLSLAALTLAACGPPTPEERVHIAGAAPEGVIAPGPAAVELRFTGPVAPDGVADGRRVALCRTADAEAVAAAAGSEGGIGPGVPVLAVRIALLDGGRRVVLQAERPLWPMASFTLVAGKGIRDAEGRSVLDPSGRARTWRHAFETGDLPPGALPQAVLTEALAVAGPPAAGGEFVEVQNRGAAPADLAGFRLAKRTATGLVQRCVLEPAEPVAPGGRALMVGGSWDGRYPMPAATPLFRCGATALLGGLADDRPVALALETPGGTVLSSLGWLAPAPRCTSGSLERIHPAGPDSPANLACPGAATPGVCNAATPASECR